MNEADHGRPAPLGRARSSRSRAVSTPVALVPGRRRTTTGKHHVPADHQAVVRPGGFRFPRTPSLQDRRSQRFLTTDGCRGENLSVSGLSVQLPHLQRSVAQRLLRRHTQTVAFVAELT